MLAHCRRRLLVCDRHRHKVFVVVHVAVVDAQALIDAGLIRKAQDGLKVLGNGELTKKLTVKAAKYTASAKEKIEAVGGTAEVI